MRVEGHIVRLGYIVRPAAVTYGVRGQTCYLPPNFWLNYEDRGSPLPRQGVSPRVRKIWIQILTPFLTKSHTTEHLSIEVEPHI